jgi:hypothetical protein
MQVLVDRCYDTGNYDRRIRYDGRIPLPPLAPQQLKWVRATLRERGKK